MGGVTGTVSDTGTHWYRKPLGSSTTVSGNSIVCPGRVKRSFTSRLVPNASPGGQKLAPTQCPDAAPHELRERGTRDFWRVNELHRAERCRAKDAAGRPDSEAGCLTTSV